MKRALLVLVAGLLFAGVSSPEPAHAEDLPRWYPYLHGGYRLNSSFKATYLGGGASQAGSSIKIPGNFVWGGGLDFRVSRTLLLEASWDRQDTDIKVEVPGFDAVDIGDLGLELWQFGIQYEFAKPEDLELEGFLTYTLGFTRFAPEFDPALIPGAAALSDSDIRFSTAFGLGVRGFFTDQIGFRLQGRFSVTFAGDGDVLGAIDGAYNSPDYVYLYLGDFLAGLTARF